MIYDWNLYDCLKFLVVFYSRNWVFLGIFLLVIVYCEKYGYKLSFVWKLFKCLRCSLIFDCSVVVVDY